MDMIRIESCGRTDVGMRRSNNEDAFVSSPNWACWPWRTGWEGAASGEVASGIFADTVRELFPPDRRPPKRRPRKLVRRTFLLANQRIRETVAREPEHKDMGCTGEMVVFTDEGYVVGHVGDSRIYLFREAGSGR